MRSRQSISAYIIVLSCGVAVAGSGIQTSRLVNELLGLIDSQQFDKRLSREVDNLSTTIRAAESAQRGYLISLDTAYLPPYDRGVETIPGILDRIERSGVFSREEVFGLHWEATAKMAELSRTVAMSRSGDSSSARSIFMGGQGRRLMVSIRERCDRMIASLDHRATNRDRPIRQSAMFLMGMAPLVGIASPVVVLLGVMLSIHSVKARTRAEDRSEIRDAEIKVAIAEKQRAEFERQSAIAEKQSAEFERQSAVEESRRNAHLLNALQHDLRTPLGGIGQTSRLGSMIASLPNTTPDKIVDMFGRIERQVIGMRDLLDQFLETSRSEHQNPEAVTFDVCPAIITAADFIRPEAESKGIAVKIECPDGLLGRTDKRLFNRILVNLLSNAAKYTERGHITIRATRDHDILSIAVEDTGRGIPADVIPGLFREFVQVGNPERDSRKGFGLGLSLVRRMVNTLGGRVEVESEVGQGSKFTVHLPDIVE